MGLWMRQLLATLYVASSIALWLLWVALTRLAGFAFEP
jgi:hypothetical protein